MEETLNRHSMHNNPCIKAIRKCCFVPQRYVLGIMGLLCVCNAFTMRVCLNFAITQMVFKKAHGEAGTDIKDPNACPDPNINKPISASTSSPYALFHWSESIQGLLLSSFYAGYASTQVIGGYAAEFYGGKWTLGVGLLSTAIFTILTPPVIRFAGAPGLFILRVLAGAGEGPTMPALMIMLARWVPPHERATQGAMVFGGAQIGNIFGSFMCGILLAEGRDWANVFYFFGGFGILWFCFWSVLCYSTPETHPFIKDKELKYLQDHVTAAKHGKRDPVPWKAILRSAPVWALVWAAVGHDWGYYAMVTDLPKYSHDVLKFDIKTAGILNTLPYIAMWIFAFIFGFICDFCIKRNWHSIKTGRIIYTTIAAVGPAIFIILASYSGCDGMVAIFYFVISMALMAGFYPGMKVNALDLAPNHAGTLTSLVNTTSTVFGMMTPFFIGLMTPDSTLVQWRLAFWVCFIVLVVTNIIYIIWAQGTQQWWDDVRQYGYPEGWKHGPLIHENTGIFGEAARGPS